MKKFLTSRIVVRTISVLLVIFWTYRLINNYLTTKKNMIPFSEVSNVKYRKKYGLPILDFDSTQIGKQNKDSEFFIELKLNTKLFYKLDYNKKYSIETDYFLLKDSTILRIAFDHPSKSCILGYAATDKNGNSKKIRFSEFYQLLKDNDFHLSNDTLFYNSKLKNGALIIDPQELKIENYYLENADKLLMSPH